jgi:integrase
MPHHSTLTELAIKAAKPPERGTVMLWDGALKHFGVRISQGGAKSFIVLLGGTGRRKTLGRFPTISLADARSLAKEFLAEYALGRHRTKAIAWDDAVTAFLAACEAKNRPSTVKGYTRLINRYFNFGRKRLAEVTYEDIEQKLARLDAPAERNHALVAVKIFLRWAQKPPRRYILHSPCEGMVPTKRPSRKRTLKPHELVAVYRAALKQEDSYNFIVALLLLTGQRRGEITTLRRMWINAADRTITLPDTITKNGIEHTFPYGDAVAAILERVPNQGDQLFPPGRSHVRGKPTTTFNAWPKSKVEFDARCDVSDWTLHDLRRTFATTLATLKVLPHIVERLLNHKLGSISSRTDGVVSAVADIYNRATYLPEMREAVETYERYLAKLIAEPIEASRVAA